MSINSLILQDDIARINDYLAQVRQGADIFEHMLRGKQLASNHSKSKCVLGSKELKDQKKRKQTKPRIVPTNITIQL